jgi:hypothetical protein
VNAARTPSTPAPSERLPGERFEGHGSARDQDNDAHKRLLAQRISDLGLRVEGSRLEPLVQALHAELERAGIDFKPRVYLSDEWGCPDGVPLIGAPFYLVDERLSSLQRELLDDIETETDAEILAYLRHEAGHAFNYAYRLYEQKDWHDLFGPYSRPYLDHYVPTPFSRAFVRHISGWYAQKHPDEDFAETFAVWLTPDSDWRDEYAEWECLPKLEYVDATVRRVGRTPPLVTVNYDEDADLAHRLGEHFERFGQAKPEISGVSYFDGDLKRLFQRAPRGSGESEDASALFRSLRRRQTSALAYWTGLSDPLLRSLLSHLSERADALGLWFSPRDRERLTIELTSYVTALCMNRLYKGDFIVK